MVGEIRDPETASIAMQASMTLPPSRASIPLQSQEGKPRALAAASPF
jgi:hypothetical protein